MKHQLIEDKGTRDRLRHQARVDLERQRQAAGTKPRRRRPSSPRLPDSWKLTADQRRAQAAIDARAAEVARRRDQLAALETGSNR